MIDAKSKNALATGYADVDIIGSRSLLDSTDSLAPALDTCVGLVVQKFANDPRRQPFFARK